MRIGLPPEVEVARALEVWRSRDARLEQLLTRYRDPAQALRHYGLILWEGGDAPTAAQVLTGAVVLTPHDARVWNDLAGALAAGGHPMEAEACLEDSLDCDAEQSSTWMQLGSLRNGRGDGLGAVAAFTKALSFDATLADAWVGLGLALLGAKQFREAVRPFREAIARGKAADAAVQGCLGQALFSIGDFSGAAAAFDEVARLQPDNEANRLKRARAHFVVDAINGPAEAAVATIERQGFAARETEQAVHDGFHLLSTFQHREAAIRLGELRLSRAPDDSMQAYLLSTLKGEPIARAPDSYIITYFDRFAEEFDRKLVDVLGYKVPGEIADLVRQFGRSVSRILDLGCGTGLAGPPLAAPGRTLTGVDLSPAMLEKAAARACYTHLVRAEASAYLEAPVGPFDLVVAADVLVYFGALSALFAGVARRLAPNGLWGLSIETAEEQDIVHLPSGRFAHNIDYVARQADAAGFTILHLKRTIVRLDADRPAFGAILLLAKAG